MSLQDYEDTNDEQPDRIDADGRSDTDSDTDGFNEYLDLVEDKLTNVPTDPAPGGIAIDMITRQPLYVHRVVATSLYEYWEQTDRSFDLLTYKQHPFLPVTVDDDVYECVYINNAKGVHQHRKTFDFPRGRLITVPISFGWNDNPL